MAPEIQAGQAAGRSIVGCTPGPTYPYGKSLYKPYITWLFMGYNPYCPLNFFNGLLYIPSLKLTAYGI